MFIYRAVDCKKYVDFKMDVRMLIKLAIMFVLTFAAFYINNIVINILMLVGVLAFTVIYNKNGFKKIIRIIKNRKSKE